MKTTLLKIAVSIFLLFSVSSFAQPVSITLLHTSDSHSRLDGMPAINPIEGGIARVATLISSIRTSEQNVMFFHSGDFMVGDFFFNKYFGVPELQILKQLGCDAMAVGNHEYDLGPGALFSVLSESFAGGSFPLLSANSSVGNFPPLTPYISSLTYKTVSGVKIGIFGLTTPDPLNNPSPIVVSDSIMEIAYQTVSILQSNGANVIICLSHLGYGIDTLLAANIPGINFILGGHDHYTTNQIKQVANPGGITTYICHSGEFYRHIGKIKFTYNSGVVSLTNFQMLNVNSSVTPEPTINGIVQGLKTGIQTTYGNVYGTVLGTSYNDISSLINYSSPNRDAALGNLVTDAYRFKTSTQIALTARGLFEDKIYAGQIVGADVIRAVPYGFDTTSGLGLNLITCNITGVQLLTGLEAVLESALMSEAFIPQTSGLTFDYNPYDSLGQKIVLSSVKVNGQPFNPASTYSLTVNEAVYGILQMLGIQVTNVNPTGIPEFAALRDKIMALGYVYYYSEGRIKDITHVGIRGNEGSVLGKYVLGNNYPNPFNPETKINYTIPETAMVSIKIYDMLGKEVTTLINTKQNAGTYSVTFRAASLSSGTYFYRLSTEKYSEVKKMVLLR